MVHKPGDIDYLAMFLEKVDKTGNNVSGTETQNKRENSLIKQRNIRQPEKFMINMDIFNPSVLRRIPC